MSSKYILLGLGVTLALLSGAGGATAAVAGGEGDAGIQTQKAVPFQILVNHLGYDTQGSKRFVVQSAGEIELSGFQVLDGDGNVAFEGDLTKTGKVDGWQGRFFHQGDFSTLTKPGRYQIKVKGLSSERFLLGERLLPEACLSDLLYYFRIQRSSGAYDKADRALGFFGEPQRGRVDVHGGWFDASGDVSKYLSHLSEANYMNPQQTPMAVWCFMQSIDLLRIQKSQRLQSVIPMLREEALYGADFLMRMQDPSGYFYTSIHDSCSKDPAQREICGYKGLSHAKHGETKAGIREGGGMAIAALARVSKLKQSGDFTPAQYLAAAEKGFVHLTRHNLEYIDDHQENILDDYCGLLAATELYSVTMNPLYLQAARSRAESLAGRLAKDERYAGWWRADAVGARPFFHAADAGLPVVALCRYQQIESDAGRKAAAGAAVTESLRFELALTKEVANPFGYARQYIKDPDGKRGAFFIPHRNETGYWWSGENARLASLASAALMGGSCTPPEMTAELKAYGRNQVNWILGLNPYDLCMMQGKGRNNPAGYEGGAPSPPGGICNGITSGVEDEHDIAFLPAPYAQRGDWSWRWNEQWIPHAAWMILALAAESADDPVEGKRNTVLLDGTWQVAEGAMNDVPTDFGHTVPVPGLVDMARPEFEEVGVKSARREVFWYRRTFTLTGPLPAVATLKVGKAMFGSRVWLNGKLLGEYLPSFTPGYFEAKAALQEGTNELLIRVGADRAAVPAAMPTGFDYEKERYIPGIFDSVELVLTGMPHLRNVQVVPDVANQRAQVRLWLQHGTVGEVTVEVCEVKSKRVVGKSSARLTAAPEQVLDLTVPLAACQLWTPESPFLYELTARTSGDVFATRFGMREFKFDPVTGRAVLNGKPYFMRGSNITLYRFFEDPARGGLPWNPDWVRRLHRRVKDMHWNSLRYCIGFPPEFWYRIADEEGILIQDEFPIWSGKFDAGELAGEFRQWLEERWNHPSVVIWDACNETNVPETGLAIQRVRGLDLSNRPWDNGWGPPGEPGDCHEAHPYHFYDAKARLADLATADPSGDSVFNSNGHRNNGTHAVIINEYGWLWLNRDGSPTTLTHKLYQNMLGKDATSGQRRHRYARYLAADTEFWRSHRKLAGVLHFTALGYSRPAGATSDHWLDVNKLEWEPEFYNYVRDAFAPVGVMIDAWEETYPAGQSREFPVAVINDLYAEWKGAVRVRLLRDGATVLEKFQPCEVPALGRTQLAFPIDLPASPGNYQLEATLIQPGAAPVRSLRDFQLK